MKQFTKIGMYESSGGWYSESSGSWGWPFWCSARPCSVLCFKQPWWCRHRNMIKLASTARLNGGSCSWSKDSRPKHILICKTYLLLVAWHSAACCFPFVFLCSHFIAFMTKLWLDLGVCLKKRNCGTIRVLISKYMLSNASRMETWSGDSKRKNGVVP